ncbi:MAG TPA: nucleotidyltransferase domain-containing protein [Propionibacteriaceae bacterium]|nr:nucleotidyltransferase domain-containing protein [Propionibacteriaceae bacterium]
MLSNSELHVLADQLVRVPGIVAVMLGGSRARGEEHPDSDLDLGLYYRPPLDTDALRRLARSLASLRGVGDQSPELTEPGGWGPWVDGGGWLTIDSTPVDWIYRDLDRVHRSAEQAVTGQFTFHFQVGHPFGVPDFAYAGEVALGVVLADPTGELQQIKAELPEYPTALGTAVIGRLTEARFLLGGLAKPARRADTTFVAGCLFRVVTLCAYAIHARAGRWVINEKGAVDTAARLAPAPAGFANRAHGVLGHLGTDGRGLAGALRDAAQLVDEVSAACSDPLRD